MQSKWEISTIIVKVIHGTTGTEKRAMFRCLHGTVIHQVEMLKVVKTSRM